MNDVAVILFHKNIDGLYPWKWIADCINSIAGQTYHDFDVFELNYGADKTQLYPDSVFFQHELSNHSDAQNFILNEVFKKPYKYAFNTNLDDFYATHRILAQLDFLRQGFDIVSSDMKHINEDNMVTEQIVLHNRDVGLNFYGEHNIIAHPACAYSRKFWTHPENPGFVFQGPTEKTSFPYDDFTLWKWALSKGFKFHIVNDFLLYYRKHDNAVSNKDNAAKLKKEWQ